MNEYIKGTEAYWSKHFSMNDWTLEKRYYKMGKSWMHDKTGFHIYGWVTERTTEPFKGQFSAGIPELYDEETGSDARELGIFETKELAMQAVFENNHPDYSSTYI